MINDVKWVQAQRHASDWRHALDSRRSSADYLRRGGPL
ncbi:PTS system sugar-specific transporter subunit EIIA 2, partial [Salmonella enterica subsp. enterica serovar Soerenga]